MLDVRELQRRAGTYSAEEFQQRYEGLFLVGTMESAPTESYSTFQRGTTLNDLEAITSRAGREAELPFALRIQKTERNHLTRHISVGRAANNDVIVLHPTVSKLHAILLVEADEEQQRLKRLLLQDAGSSNGTKVNGLPAPGPDQEPVPISPGDRLLFGHVACTLVDVMSFRRWLLRLEHM